MFPVLHRALFLLNMSPLSIKKLRHILVLSSFFCLLCQPSAYAQIDIDAADTQEQIRQAEEARRLREQLRPKSDVRLQRPNQESTDFLVIDQRPCFMIDSIRLEGDQADKFQWALEAASQSRSGKADTPYGRCLGAGAINTVMSRVQNAITARGFITTRVLAEPQDLRAGSLVLTLLPGIINNIRYDGSDKMVSPWYSRPMRKGRILQLRHMEQALENLRRVPTQQANMDITPSKEGKPGESDILLSLDKQRPYRLSASINDAGSDSTGKYQGSLTLSVDRLFSLSDLFYLTYNNDLGGGDSGPRGSNGYNLYYAIPYGYWSFSVSASDSEYTQTVAGAVSPLLYSGTSQNAGFDLSRLIYRNATRKITASAKAWTRRSNNFINDTEVEVQRRRMAGWEMGVSYRQFIGAKTLDLNINYRKGTGANGALAAPEEALGQGTSRPEIVNANLYFASPFELDGQRFNFSTSWRLQWDMSSLIPQDRFSIGSRYTVRGFDGESTLLAERGLLSRNDISWRIPKISQQLYWALDAGQVSGESSDALAGKSLIGTALGMRGEVIKIQYDVFVGMPLKKPTGFTASSQVAGVTATWNW